MPLTDWEASVRHFSARNHDDIVCKICHSPSWTDPAASSSEKPVKLEYIAPTLYPNSPPTSLPVVAFHTSTEYNRTIVISCARGGFSFVIIIARIPLVFELISLVLLCISRKAATMGGYNQFVPLIMPRIRNIN